MRLVARSTGYTMFAGFAQIQAEIAVSFCSAESRLTL